MGLYEYEKLPDERWHEPVARYLENKIPPGSFLSAVICNDLREACGRADMLSRVQLFDLVVWFYNYAPSNSWGSPEKFEAWLRPATEEANNGA
jgi:hypothetical protein